MSWCDLVGAFVSCQGIVLDAKVNQLELRNHPLQWFLSSLNSFACANQVKTVLGQSKNERIGFISWKVVKITIKSCLCNSWKLDLIEIVECRMSRGLKSPILQ